MADNHGNTPAAWTAVAVAMVGFVVGSVALLLSPVNLTLLWIGLGLAAIALPVFIIMAKLGLHGDTDEQHGRDVREHTQGRPS